MGTRGFIGFVVDGAEKIAYKHNDAYPDGLGLAVLEWAWVNRHGLTCDIHRGESGGPVDLVRRLRVVDAESEPSDADIEQLKDFYNPNVGGRTERPTWYQLLRGAQGEPDVMLRAGVIEDAGGFPADSLFAQWGYVVDVDARTFETYVGFQKQPHNKGRFAIRPTSENHAGTYYPVALAASWPLDGLPSEAEFLAAFAADDEVAAR